MPYSAVTQPFPVLRRKGGTRSSMLAVQITFVRPTSMSTDPSACARKFGVMVVGRGSAAERPSMRVMYYPVHALSERMPQVHMTRECVDFLAVYQNLHARDGGQVDSQRVDDGVDREDLVKRAAAVLRGDIAAQIDEGVAAFGHENLAQLRLRGDRRNERRRRRELCFDDGAGLIADRRGKRHLTLYGDERQTVVRHVEQRGGDPPDGRRGRRRCGHGGRRARLRAV